MVKGLWKTITLVCGCHDEETVMGINNGPHSLFYSCPKYYPENRSKDERACANRINLVDYERMLNHISLEISKRIHNNETTDMTNYKWEDKKSYITYEVISHTADEIKIKMRSRKALR